jgi:hypothetical protein
LAEHIGRVFSVRNACDVEDGHAVTGVLSNEQSVAITVVRKSGRTYNMGYLRGNAFR